MHPDTVAVHSGRSPDAVTGAVAESITLSTTFARTPDNALVSEYIYSRERSPNRKQLETALAAMDGGADAAAFASGLAATAAVFQALAPGDHVLAARESYYGMREQLHAVFSPWGLQFDLVDMSSLEAVAAAVRPTTRLLWAETPSNPTLAISDIAGLAHIAHGVGAQLAVDNTWATAIGQRTFEQGADLAMYSTTKYHGGHSDVLSGALVTRAVTPLWERIRRMQGIIGAVPSPFDAWLVHRGMASMPLRFRHQSASAMQLATQLEKHPGVERVHYPGLASHPQHAVAVRQMRYFGGMLSIQVRGGAAEAIAVAGRLRLFTRATSLGGVESLIEHRKTAEGPTSLTPDNLLRISVGLEDVQDLWADLEQALSGA